MLYCSNIFINVFVWIEIRHVSEKFKKNGKENILSNMHGKIPTIMQKQKVEAAREKRILEQRLANTTPKSKKAATIKLNLMKINETLIEIYWKELLEERKNQIKMKKEDRVKLNKKIGDAQKELYNIRNYMRNLQFKIELKLGSKKYDTSEKILAFKKDTRNLKKLEKDIANYLKIESNSSKKLQNAISNYLKKDNPRALLDANILSRENQKKSKKLSLASMNKASLIGISETELYQHERNSLKHAMLEYLEKHARYSRLRRILKQKGTNPQRKKKIEHEMAILQRDMSDVRKDRREISKILKQISNTHKTRG
jgi:hypothetical protein